MPKKRSLNHRNFTGIMCHDTIDEEPITVKALLGAFMAHVAHELYGGSKDL